MSPEVSTAAGELFEIVDVEAHGRRLRAFKNAAPSLRAIWDMSAAHGDATYLVYDEQQYTFTGAHEIVAALAQQLAEEHGVTRGDRVAVAMRNFPEWAFSFWAATCLGAVVVPLNAWWTGPELAYGLADSGTKVLLTDGERWQRLEPHLDDTKVETIVVARATTPLPDRVLAFDHVVQAGDAGYALPSIDIQPDDDATIMYTSGTTGRPKGAVGTHRNIGNHIMNALYAAASRAPAAPAASPDAATADTATVAPSTRPVTLLTFPLFHVGGLQSFLLPYTVIGGKVVLLYKWDPARALALIEREGVNNVAGVPTTMFELLDEARRQGKELPSLAGVASGATLVPPELVRRIDSQLEHRAAPTNGYGLTETCGAAVANAGSDYVLRPDSVGTPISPTMEVRIADEAGHAVPVGDTGEIWIKGPTVFRGYFDNDEATAAAITDGWFHTGDVGRLDDAGYLYVVDRLKDVIVRGGENVYAAEVEAVLYEHPDVAEAAIVGLPDPKYGEQIVAIVRLRPGSTLDEAGVRDHVASRLATFKVPSIVRLTPDSLPRNAAGKVLKRDLRNALAAAEAN